MPRRKPKKIIIIAGPNGAGKTTLAQEFLPREAECPVFINADLIARGLSPFASEEASFQAGKIMLNQIAANVDSGKSFAFETTLSGKSYARQIPFWRRAGFHVKQSCLRMPSAELCITRVSARVAQGGHGVPKEVIRRRFVAGLRNFEQTYRKIVDRWVLYDNARPTPWPLEFGSNR